MHAHDNTHQFAMQVIVQGISTVERAVITRDKEKEGDKYMLLVEGTNLQAVMATQGKGGTCAFHSFLLKEKGRHIQDKYMLLMEGTNLKAVMATLGRLQ